MGILWPSIPGRVSLPINNALIEPIKVFWSMLASVPLTAKHMEKYYFVAVQGFEGFYSSLAPNSLIITAVNDRAKQGSLSVLPRIRILNEWT